MTANMTQQGEVNLSCDHLYFVQAYQHSLREYFIYFPPLLVHPANKTRMHSKFEIESNLENRQQ